jgi:hypothetical protein
MTRADQFLVKLQSSLVIDGSRLEPELKFLFAQVCLIFTDTVEIRVKIEHFDVYKTHVI